MTIREEIEERGIQKGRAEERGQVILKLLQKNLEIPFISEVTGLPEAEVIQFKNGGIQSRPPKAGDVQNGKAE